MFVPVGGGGLAAGIASVLKAADPAIRVVGCQPAASDVMRQSVAAGRVVEADWRPTLSEGTVGGLEAGAITLEPCSRFVDGAALPACRPACGPACCPVFCPVCPMEVPGKSGIAGACWLSQGRSCCLQSGWWCRRGR